MSGKLGRIKEALTLGRASFVSRSEECSYPSYKYKKHSLVHTVLCFLLQLVTNLHDLR